MYNSIPDIYRKRAVENLFDTNTFKNCWGTWQPEIIKRLGKNFTEIEILNLGDQLSEIFRTTGDSGRGQGSLSGGGTAWESLICWYVNLCTVGSRVVALKKMSLVPLPIQDAITINYGNFACNTESDITVIILPNENVYYKDINRLETDAINEISVPFFIKKLFNIKIFNFLAARDFNKYEIGIIQCKTNWNDNAQIPMLWDMIYSAGGFRGRNITIGRNNFSIQNLKCFTYSFATVPSNQNTVFKANSVAVKRVTNLSGGNYWGKPTETNVAKSMKEIFTNNFNSGSRASLRIDLKTALPQLNRDGVLNYFRLL